MFHHSRSSRRAALKRAARTTLALSVVLGIAACSSTASGASSNTGKVANVTYVGVVGLPMPESAAQTEGFFAKAGVKVTEKTLVAGTNAMAAMVGGSTDFAVGGDTRLVQSAAQGLPIVAVGLQQTDFPSYLVVPAADHTTKSFADLKGKKIAIEVGSSQQAGVVRYLEAVGLSPDSFDWVNLAKDAAVAAVASKSVAAAVFTDEFEYAAVSKKIARVILTPKQFSAKSGAQWPFMLMTTKKLIAQHPDVVQKFVDGWTCAKEYLVKNPAKARSLMRAQFKNYDPQLVTNLMSNTSWTQQTINKSLVTDIKAQGKALITLGALKSVPSLNGYIDNSFVEKAIQTCK